MSVTKRLSYFQNSQNCRVHMHHYKTKGRYFASISNILVQHIMALKKTSVKNIFVIFSKFFLSETLVVKARANRNGIGVGDSIRLRVVAHQTFVVCGIMLYRLLSYSSVELVLP